MTENQRKWAIEEIENSILPDACDEVAERALEYALEALSQPERPKGRWVEVWRGDYIATLKCSVCGRRINIDPANNEKEILRKYPYCHCGADMRDHIPEATKKVEDGEEEC